MQPQGFVDRLSIIWEEIFQNSIGIRFNGRIALEGVQDSRPPSGLGSQVEEKHLRQGKAEVDDEPALEGLRWQLIVVWYVSMPCRHRNRLNPLTTGSVDSDDGQRRIVCDVRDKILDYQGRQGAFHSI